MPRFVIINDSQVRRMSASAISHRFKAELAKLDRAMRSGGGCQYGWDMTTANVYYPEVCATLRRLAFAFDLCSR